MTGSEHESEHDEFDCSRARMQLYEYLDGEMAPGDINKIREHLAHCAPCLQEYDLDQTLKALIRRSCSCESAPLALRYRLAHALALAKIRPALGRRSWADRWRSCSAYTP